MNNANYEIGTLPPYDKAVRYALAHSLEAACLAYMEDTMTSGRMLCPHTN